MPRNAADAAAGPPKRGRGRAAASEPEWVPTQPPPTAPPPRQAAADALGTNLRVLRALRRFSQKELAKRAEISRPYLAGIESALRLGPSADVVARLARALGVTPEDLRGQGDGYRGDEYRRLTDAIFASGPAGPDAGGQPEGPDAASVAPRPPPDAVPSGVPPDDQEGGTGAREAQRGATEGPAPAPDAAIAAAAAPSGATARDPGAEPDDRPTAGYARLVRDARPVYAWGSRGDPRRRAAAPVPIAYERIPLGREAVVGRKGFALPVRGEHLIGRGLWDGELCWVVPDAPDREYADGTVVAAIVRRPDQTAPGGLTGLVLLEVGRTEDGIPVLCTHGAGGRDVVEADGWEIVGPVVGIQSWRSPDEPFRDTPPPLRWTRQRHWTLRALPEAPSPPTAGAAEPPAPAGARRRAG